MAGHMTWAWRGPWRTHHRRSGGCQAPACPSSGATWDWKPSGGRFSALISSEKPETSILTCQLTTFKRTPLRGILRRYSTTQRYVGQTEWARGWGPRVTGLAALPGWTLGSVAIPDALLCGLGGALDSPRPAP